MKEWNKGSDVSGILVVEPPGDGEDSLVVVYSRQVSFASLSSIQGLRTHPSWRAVQRSLETCPKIPSHTMGTRLRCMQSTELQCCRSGW